VTISSSTPKPKEILEQALGAIPKNFRTKLVEHYLNLKRRLAAKEFEPAGLSAGKFSEIALRTLQHSLTGSSIPFNRSIGNFPDECRKLIMLPSNQGTESLRIIIPRGLAFLYTFRNKRNIGHVGGDVDPNEIDAVTMARVADWIVCELIRSYHNLSLEEAQALVDSLAVRHLPDIWEIGGRKRVLRSDLGYKEQVLLLLYSCPDRGALTEDVYKWSKYSDLSMFKRSVLRPLDSDNLIDYDEEVEYVTLSPLGIATVEDEIMKHEGI
jgi:hypothetical protein